MSARESLDYLDHASAEGPEIQALSDWLIDQGLGTPDPKRLHAEFCERVVRLGVPLWRGFVGVRTLHPRIEAVNYVWHRGGDPRRWLVASEVNESQEWRQSPFA